MIRLVYLLIFPLFFSLTLSACKSMTPGTAKRAYCNMLKSNLVFNGQTSIARDANIENSETPLDQRQYEAECE
jgi:hypothetical protein